MPNSDKKVWWKCQNGHKWQAIIGNRNKGQGCPYCSGKKVLKGFNDLQTANPTLAKEWNYEKNNALTPTDVTTGSNKKVWWKCQNGHEWQASIVDRNNGHRCPYCTGKRVLEGFNDLQTVNPTLAAEWHYEKNIGLTPTDVTPGSNKKVWWKCRQGHEWQATIANRNYGTGCPECYKLQKGQRQINMYKANTFEFIDSFDSVKSICVYLGLDYLKTNGSISRVCRRKQKTLMGKYILRYASDDEIQKIDAD